MHRKTYVPGSRVNEKLCGTFPVSIGWAKVASVESGVGVWGIVWELTIRRSLDVYDVFYSCAWG